MNLSEPAWRQDILAALSQAKATRNFRQLEALLQEHLTDSFDMLVQAIVRNPSPSVAAVLHKRYPGSVERQLEIENLMRADSDR